MKEFKVSIIIPVYNVELYIEDALKSILMQTHKNFEAIIIDDGSTDRSMDIAEKLVCGDDRFKIYHKANGGLSSARNMGLDNVTGDYITFLDSDDSYNPRFLEIMLEKIRANDYDFVSCCANFVDSKGELLRRNTYKEECVEIVSNDSIFQAYMSSNYIEDAAWNKIYRRDIFENLYFKEGIIYEDSEIIIRILKRCNKVLFVREYLYNYRIREGSIMNYTEDKNNSLKVSFDKKKIDVLKVYEMNAQQLNGTRWRNTYYKKILLSCCELSRMRKSINETDRILVKKEIKKFFRKYHKFLYFPGLFSIKQIAYIEYHMIFG